PASGAALPSRGAPIRSVSPLTASAAPICSGTDDGVRAGRRVRPSSKSGSVVDVLGVGVVVVVTRVMVVLGTAVEEVTSVSVVTGKVNVVVTRVSVVTGSVSVVMGTVNVVVTGRVSVVTGSVNGVGTILRVVTGSGSGTSGAETGVVTAAARAVMAG